MSKSAMTYERITPEKAQFYLDKNLPTNRGISMSRVSSYADDMLSGNWSDNCTTIKFNSAGDLIDGQHRLSAIVKSGKTVSMWVARGVDENAFKTVDTGYIRSGKQIIKMDNDPDELKKHPTIIAIIRFLFRVYGSNRRPTISQIYECIESNRDLLEWYYSVSPLKDTNAPVVYPITALALHLYGVSDEDIFGFVNAAIYNNFDSGKPASSYKHAVQAETFRKNNNRNKEYTLFLRYAYSFIHNTQRLTLYEHPYECTMDGKYKLIKK